MEVFDKLQEDTKELISKGKINFRKSPKDRITVSYVETRLEVLENEWQLFVDVHRQIITEVTKKDLETSSYFKNSIYDTTEQIYLDYKTELKEILLKLKGKDIPSVESVKSSSEDTKSKYFVKLPEISIPKFSGKYLEWTSFRDLFTSLIHKNAKLDDVQKLHYLKSHLSGEAEQLLRHVPITDKNYSVCWTQLTNRYDNKKYLANNILRRFMSQKTLQNESSIAIRELLDNMNECLSALQNIEIDISNWDIIVIYILSQKLDPESRKQWESKANESEELPTLSGFREFLEHKFRSLEFLNAKPKSLSVSNKVNVSHVANINGSNTSNQSNFSCQYCKADHKLINCKDFAKADYKTRHNFVRTSRLCFNCMAQNHPVFACRQASRCRVCRRKHHSLLHPQSTEKVESDKVESGKVESENGESSDKGLVVSSATTSQSDIVTCCSNVHSQVLLATALVKVESRTGGTEFVVRCLVDQGSMASLISESTVQALGLKKIPNKTYISGIGSRDKSLASMSMVEIKLKSIHDPQYTLVVKAHVLNKLTSFLPSRKANVQLWPELNRLKLADPKFDIPNKIDLLLGAEVYSQILIDGLIKGPSGYPVAQNTQLGWILSGQISSEASEAFQENNIIVSMHTQSNESDLLRKFWELESDDICSKKKMLTDEERRCEEIFANTVTRDECGRYVVKLPFRDDNPTCKKGGFELQKWASSSKEFMEKIGKGRVEKESRLEIGTGKETEAIQKVLGLTWNSSTDEFEYNVQLPPIEVPVTKRKEWLTYRSEHVRSKDNPADCASRGVKNYDNLNLWKQGPSWLREVNINYSLHEECQDTKLEEKSRKIICHTVKTVELNENFFTRFSTLRKLVRAVAYLRRFCKWLSSRSTKFPAYLTSQELKEALQRCISYFQRKFFSGDIESIAKTGLVIKKSKLIPLNPFLDNEGLLRIGGRLHNAELSDNRKHCVLIPRDSHLAKLLVADAHEKTLHGGPQLMLNYIRSNYWIIDAKNLVKLHVRKCVTCIRHAPSSNQPIMGQLPASRVTAGRPFRHSGVDYAGPVAIRTSKGRGHRSIKGYICLFICMATRAIHLEAVTDMTSQGFLAAFKRMVARRGHVTDLWSDNGTNFVCAEKELKVLLAEERSTVAVEIASWLASNGTTWHRIPPYSPNFGGLWEAGIKSTKYHLKRVIGNSTLTYEEMSTVLSQIEACLNSRPLTTLSNEAQDPVPLTPGHFLVGEPLVLVPDTNYEKSNISSLRRWQLTQRMTQDFWRRWSNEYLTQFLHRYRWNRHSPEPKIGDVVLVKEENLPPARWLYGVIIDKHPGSDNVTRVVSLRCKGTIIKRPVSKICILPIND
ncbi:uncharacterized protein LOC123874713 [Maniola jurtina]|uniref:uncharacterized protein LOC123874713 n=1 Tax=Maniola jurtina TaxID=191418 RepID=UPI001E685D0B|nr:uncharacterized protein LOC123874713 [Maniola jurtina]